LFNKILRKYEFIFEKKYLKKADLITTVDPILAEDLSRLHKKPSECSYNGFWGYYEQKNKQTAISHKLILSHVGTLTPGQRVEFLLQAIVELDEDGSISSDNLEVRFIGLEYFSQQVERIRFFNNAICKYLSTTPRVSQEEALDFSYNSDFLLSFTERNYKAIYAKTYDYLSVGRPILVLPDDESILSRLVTILNAGYVFADIHSLKEFLIERIKWKQEGKQLEKSKTNKEKAGFYTRENQARSYFEILKRLNRKVS